MPTSRLVLLDNTVLTNFALVNRAELVLDLWGSGCGTTAAVLAEFQAGVAGRGLPANIWKDLTILTLDAKEIDLENSLPPILGKGERTCIAIAVHRNALFVSDDAAARRAARRLGISVSGTLGILVLNIRQTNLSLIEGNNLLSAMISHGYRTTILSLNDLI